ncbi:ABC transporter ATP-binding protein [Candidatus Leptofilum sp.]|uniref:ABC transporter ATP-binding protein n=1 Tax=Candidatus Leptofilum sp. TaxID=3241576 RepID=UPI003B5BD4DF
MGITGGLNPEEYDRSYSDRELVRRIVGYFRPHIGKVLLVAAMVSLISILATATPIIISRGIDTLAANPQLQLLLTLAAVVTVMGALSWGFNFVSLWFSARAVGEVVLALREDAFRAVMRRDLSFYDQFASGRIVSRVTSDTQDFATVVTLTIDLLSQIVLVLVIGLVLATQNTRLALITFTVGPIVVTIALVFRRLARNAMQQAQRALATVNATIQETISGIGVAKNFRQEAAIYDDFQEVNELAYRVQLNRVAVFGSIFPLLNTVSGIAVSVIIYVGGLMAIQQDISVGEWYLFVQGLTIFFYPITSLASFWSQFQQGLAASERVFALIDDEPLVIQKANDPIEQLRGDIAFDKVTFNYSTGRSTVLQDFSLNIPAGQTLAIVGHTGAGKSSLVKVLMRFYEYQGGDVLVDGRSIRSLDLSQYRRQLGLVPQAPFLFSGTVAENVKYGRPNASDVEVETAARQLGDGSWLEDLPNGLQTDVGERGARLSLGQRQLVALARVLLQNPAILLLDEATASIDPLTEAQVQDALATVLQNRTSIIIAHRLSTVRAADRIIVLRDGQIIEEGNHDALLAQNGHYAELYTTYFRHQSLEYRPW